MIGLATSIAARINMGRYKVLKFDRQTYEYFPIEFDLNERNKKDEQW